MKSPLRRAERAICLSLLVFAGACSVRNASAQEALAPVVVRGAELPSAYGAPPAFSRTRFAPTTTAYVLPPGSFLSATIYQGEYNHGEHPGHLFTQEIEVGLPHRFGLAFEASPEVFRGRSQIRNVSLEARYALAAWNKIPLNPTIFVEYKFGTGHILREEREGEEDGGDEDLPDAGALRRKVTSKLHQTEGDEGADEDEGEDDPELPDAVEARLLLAQDFGEHFEWALNGFVEQETSGDRGREWGFAQSISIPLTRNEWLKAGLEMQYTNFTDKDTRSDPEHRFVIGPTIAWKPNRWSRIDVSPLFGVTHASPDAQVFVVFSMLFGGNSSGEAEAPVSTRNR
jgi:hypothetical protein